MVGQGWEPKRPTLSKRCIPLHKAVGLGLFPLSRFLCEEWAQHSPHRPIILPVYRCHFLSQYIKITPINDQHPREINQWEKTKTYGLVGLNGPLRQGRSLWLPTLPYQKANRYAVVGITVYCYISVLRKTYVVPRRFRLLCYEFKITTNLQKSMYKLVALR